MQMLPNRIVIYTKDVVNITGLSERTARKLLARIRTAYQINKSSFVTIEEFCRFTGLREEKVAPFLK